MKSRCFYADYRGLGSLWNWLECFYRLLSNRGFVARLQEWKWANGASAPSTHAFAPTHPVLQTRVALLFISLFRSSPAALQLNRGLQSLCPCKSSSSPPRIRCTTDAVINTWRGAAFSHECAYSRAQEINAERNATGPISARWSRRPTGLPRAARLRHLPVPLPCEHWNRACPADAHQDGATGHDLQLLHRVRLGCGAAEFARAWRSWVALFACQTP